MASVSVFTRDEKEEEEEEVGSGLIDRISSLPEGIILSILSLLTHKEAVKTSLLSCRWVYFWMSALTVLDFDSPKVSPARRTEFKQWASRVVRQLNNATTSTKFRVSFTLSNQYSFDGDKDQWLKFTISNRFEYLKLCSSNPTPASTREGKSCGYAFPEDCFNNIVTPSGLSDVKSLRSLRLSCVEVEARTIEHFISECPYLEELAVHRSDSLRELKIAAADMGSSSSLALKRLEVVRCRCLISLEIYNVSCLTHFTYRGHWTIGLRLKDCVSLVDVNIGFDGSCIKTLVFDLVSCYAAQLTALAVLISPVFTRFSKVAEFVRLKLLTVEAYPTFVVHVPGLDTLINACPNLHTLRVKINACQPRVMTKAMQERDNIKGRHESIKVVEIIGFTCPN
ncbi:unnamed protein product [Linum tenue]|uniref:At1g61320/AtMIF1 LRR domain-containing protein n=1 Tax=Linum tenue TaxID=586396 RepID=A0AAV0ICV8_9ROSI|nr:unnamed protein product [Linum tenue]